MAGENQDISAVINIVNLYPIAVDSLRFELFDGIFTEDAHVDFGGPAQWHDLATLKRDFFAIHSPYQATQHRTTNHHVTFENGRARCISYVHARFIREPESGDNLFEACGWYDDVLITTAGGWRIARRTNRTFWSGGNPKVMETMPGVTVTLEHHTLSAEAEAGRVETINALEGRWQTV